MTSQFATHVPDHCGHVHYCAQSTSEIMGTRVCDGIEEMQKLQHTCVLSCTRKHDI